MKYKYSQQKTIPAPSIQIRLALPDASFGARFLSALVDTGADFCIVPEKILDRLGSEGDDYVRMRGQGSEPRELALHTLDIEIANSRYPDIDVVADDKEDEIVLGRNLLNQLVITLDGPKQELEIKM